MERSTVQSCLAAPFKINDLAAIFQKYRTAVWHPGQHLGQQRAKSAFQALIRARKRPKAAGESLAPANRAAGPRWRPWRPFRLGSRGPRILLLTAARAN